MPRKPFNNKTDFDPGRLRFVLTIYEKQAIDDGYGGTTVDFVEVLQTKAGKMKISEGNQMALQAGATVFNQDTYFIIRNRKDFIVKKDMRIMCDGVGYTILGITPLDIPQNYWKVLAQRSDWTYGNP